MNFTETATEMHAEAGEREALMREKNEAREAMDEARGNDGVRPFMDEAESLESRESRWAHWILTGGE